MGRKRKYPDLKDIEKKVEDWIKNHEEFHAYGIALKLFPDIKDRKKWGMINYYISEKVRSLKDKGFIKLDRKEEGQAEIQKKIYKKVKGKW